MSNAKKPTFLSLPPDVIVNILSFLPLSNLPHVAQVSRRVKILTYNDGMYIPKLQVLGVRSDMVADTVVDSITNQIKMLPGGQFLPGNNKYWEQISVQTPETPVQEPEKQDKIEALLPGVKKSNLVIGAGGLKAATKENSGQKKITLKTTTQNTRPKRELFKSIISDLRIYYFDFIKKQKDSRVFKDYKDITEIAIILHRLLILHKANFFEKSETIENIEFNLNSSIEWFSALVLGQFERGYDTGSIEEMREAALALYNLDGGASCVQLFIAKNPIFFDEKYNPSLNPAKMPSATQPATNYNLANDFADFMDSIMSICKKEIVLIQQVFVKEMNTLATFAGRVFEDSISEYMNTTLKVAKERESQFIYLHTLAACVYCLSQWLDQLKKTGGADIAPIKVAANEILKPFTEKYLSLEIEIMQKKLTAEVEAFKTKDRKKMAPSAYIVDQEKAIAHKRAVMKTFRAVLFAPVALTSSLASNTAKLFSSNKVKPLEKSQNDLSKSKEQLNSPIVSDENSASKSNQELSANHLDDANYTGMLSLQLCMSLIHLNKDSLARTLIITFTTEQNRTKSNVEKVFIQLLKIIGESHIKPAFQSALDKLKNSVPTDWYIENKGANSDSLQFFELVHLADLISQMLEVYYQEDIKPWIDESDFLSDLFVERKAFERLLDDHVAAGMDKSVQVLINQVDYILLKEQLPADYNPSSESNGRIFDLKPTNACLSVIKCLKIHTQMLTGATDKHTMEVFLGEIGVRLFNSLTKHIKRLVISQTGAMRLIWQVFTNISDLNSYNEWACQLRVGQVTKLFSVLKEVGNLFIADGGHELKDLVHDQQRYQGALRLDEVLELLASRSDFKQIQKYVESKECIIQ